MGRHAEGPAKGTHSSLDAKNLKIAIVVSRFNSLITAKLLAGAERKLSELGVAEPDLHVYWVPGAFEIPRAVRALAQQKKYDGILPLGCVIRGETPHFEHISREVSQGLMRLSLECDTPIVFGVLTTDTVKQARARAGAKLNRGAEVAQSLIELINLLKKI
jgi:6,7-dimethyl-8-ribityllumazine synthase